MVVSTSRELQCRRAKIPQQAQVAFGSRIRVSEFLSTFREGSGGGGGGGVVFLKCPFSIQNTKVLDNFAAVQTQ